LASAGRPGSEWGKEGGDQKRASLRWKKATTSCRGGKGGNMCPLLPVGYANKKSDQEKTLNSSSKKKNCQGGERTALHCTKNV